MARFAQQFDLDYGHTFFFGPLDKSRVDHRVASGAEASSGSVYRKSLGSQAYISPASITHDPATKANPRLLARFTDEQHVLIFARLHQQSTTLHSVRCNVGLPASHRPNKKRRRFQARVGTA